MPTTSERIIDAAAECFYRHGYAATNISMISRYAEISRVTIHKQFGTKEEVFRSVCRRHHQTIQSKLDLRVSEHANMWCALAAILRDWGRPIFDQINDPHVLRDLVHAAQLHSEDLIKSHTQVLVTFISGMLDDADNDKLIRLDNIELNSVELAELLTVSFVGTFSTVLATDVNDSIEKLIKLYEAALRTR